MNNSRCNKSMTLQVPASLRTLLSLIFICLGCYGYSQDEKLSFGQGNKVNLDSLVDVALDYLNSQPGKVDSLVTEIQPMAIQNNDSSVLTQLMLIEGIQFARVNSFDSALNSFQVAWENGYKLRDTLLMIMSLNNIAGVYNYMQNYTRSLEYNQKAIDLMSDPTKKISRAKLLLSRGKIQNMNHQSADALVSLKEAADIFEAQGEQQLWLNTLREMGVAYAAQDKHMDALSLYYAVLPLMQSEASGFELIELKQRMAESYTKIGEFHRALPLLKESLAAIDSLHIELAKEPVLQLLIEVSAELGQVEEAMRYSRMLLDYTREMEESNVRAAVEELELKYQARQKTLENEVLQSEAKQRQLELENTRYLLMVVLALLVIVFGGFFAAFLYNRKVKALNSQLADLNAGLEMAVTQKTARLEERNKKIIDATFSLAHEIRSNVVTVLGAVQLMKAEAGLDEADAELIEAVYESSDKLDKSVRELITKLEQ